ncbi:MAG TPA: hypothetical protein VFZ34_26795 [Blastocatellia bacterium]|nr:hypothetical protein [Blastocatellia bacterium]
MNYQIRDELQLHRYKKLTSAQQARVDRTVLRHIAACAKLGVAPEAEPTFKEAIDIVLAGNWEADRPLDKMETRWHYDVYTSPLREAA